MPTRRGLLATVLGTLAGALGVSFVSPALASQVVKNNSAPEQAACPLCTPHVSGGYVRGDLCAIHRLSHDLDVESFARAAGMSLAEVEAKAGFTIVDLGNRSSTRITARLVPAGKPIVCRGAAFEHAFTGVRRTL